MTGLSSLSPAKYPLDLNGEGGEFLPSDADLVFRQSLIEGGEPVEVDFSRLTFQSEYYSVVAVQLLRIKPCHYAKFVH